jgi:hypothetical protein
VGFCEGGQGVASWVMARWRRRHRRSDDSASGRVLTRRLLSNVPGYLQTLHARGSTLPRLMSRFGMQEPPSRKPSLRAHAAGPRQIPHQELRLRLEYQLARHPGGASRPAPISRRHVNSLPTAILVNRRGVADGRRGSCCPMQAKSPMSKSFPAPTRSLPPEKAYIEAPPGRGQFKYARVTLLLHSCYSTLAPNRKCDIPLKPHIHCTCTHVSPTI